MERMDSDPNPFPKIDILCLCGSIGATVRSVIELGRVVEPCLSSYPKHPERRDDKQLSLEL